MIDSITTTDGAPARQRRSSRPDRQAGQSRRMALLKRLGLFGGDTRGAMIQRAIDFDDLHGAYALVHDVFVELGYILPRESGLRVRVYEALPETATFIAKAADLVVGVQSLVVDTDPFGLPSDEAFGVELGELRVGGRRLCEATNEAIAPEFRKSGIPTELMRCCFAHALSVGCNELITTVSPGHAKFYELLGFRPISPVRSYSAEIDDPVVVVSMDLDRLSARVAAIDDEAGDDEAFLKQYYLDGNPYHRSVAAWAKAAAAFFNDPAGLGELFIDHAGPLAGCSEQALEAIRRHWGDEVYDGVWDDSSERLHGRQAAAEPTLVG